MELEEMEHELYFQKAAMAVCEVQERGYIVGPGRVVDALRAAFRRGFEAGEQSAWDGLPMEER